MVVPKEDSKSVHSPARPRAEDWRGTSSAVQVWFMADEKLVVVIALPTFCDGRH